jgi:hypothetical protein
MASVTDDHDEGLRGAKRTSMTDGADAPMQMGSRPVKAVLRASVFGTRHARRPGPRTEPADLPASRLLRLDSKPGQAGNGTRPGATAPTSVDSVDGEAENDAGRQGSRTPDRKRVVPRRVNAIVSRVFPSEADTTSPKVAMDLDTHDEGAIFIENQDRGLPYAAMAHSAPGAAASSDQFPHRPTGPNDYHANRYPAANLSGNNLGFRQQQHVLSSSAASAVLGGALLAGTALCCLVRRTCERLQVGSLRTKSPMHGD